MSIYFQTVARSKPFPEVTAPTTLHKHTSTEAPLPHTLARAVTLATKLPPLKGTCLTRSLTLAKLLRRYGYEASVIIGVPTEESRKDPWTAHAWVETKQTQATNNHLELARFEL